MCRSIGDILSEVASYKIEDWHIHLGKLSMEDLQTIIDFGYNSDFIRNLHNLTRREIDRRKMEGREDKLNELGIV